MTVSLLVLLLLSSCCDSLPSSRSSFLLPSTVGPLVHFRLPDVRNPVTLLLSPDDSTLYVGAQNAVLSLDISRSDVITLKQQVTWKPSEEEVQKCKSKGKNATVDCVNVVHVLQQINSSHLYACGSFAFSPRDAFIDIQSFSLTTNVEVANGRCPFSPVETPSAIAVDGELFTCSTTDFRGHKPQISRFLSKDGRPDVNLETSVLLLSEPRFVGSWSDAADGKLYFFFNEVGKEFQFVDELQIPRVAQVCKDDVGGQRTLQKKWTSFAKASLLCGSPKQLPFNLLQDVVTLPPAEGAAHTLLYAVFTSQWSVGRQSAVCVFRLEEVRSQFRGTFKRLDMQSDRWTSVKDKHLGKCGLANASDSELAEVKRSFLTSGSVTPVGGAPLLVSTEEQYSRVAVLRTKAANGTEFTVLFLLTDSGFLHKVVLFKEGPQVIEEIQVFTSPQQIKSLVLSPSKRVVLVGTSAGVTAVPTSQCSAHSSCSQCLLSRDPQCGWSPSGRSCAAVEGSQENLVQNLDDSNNQEECREQTDPPLAEEVVVSLDEVGLTTSPSRARRPSEEQRDQPEGEEPERAAVTEREEPKVTYQRHAEVESAGRSFHSELVVVSLLLGFCVCVLILGSLYVLRLRRNRLKVGGAALLEDGKTKKCVSDSKDGAPPE